MKTRPGFVAALDESGGSTPKTLSAYGIPSGSWSNDDQMFALVHQMRTRVMLSPVFTGDRILAAILFENTMDRTVGEKPSADYLWEVKRVVPFLKVDKGLAEEKGRRAAYETDSRPNRFAEQGEEQPDFWNQDAFVYSPGQRRWD